MENPPVDPSRPSRTLATAVVGNPQFVIWRAIRRYKIRRLTREIRENDSWLFDVALSGRLSQYCWPLLMHTPATLHRIQKLLEDFGADRKSSSAHARIVVLSLLLAGIRPVGELAVMHKLAHHMANMCERPDAPTDRAMFLSLYPKACRYIMDEFENVLSEIRSAAVLYSNCSSQCCRSSTNLDPKAQQRSIPTTRPFKYQPSPSQLSIHPACTTQLGFTRLLRPIGHGQYTAFVRLIYLLVELFKLFSELLL